MAHYRDTLTEARARFDAPTHTAGGAVTGSRFTDAAAAMAWVQTERPNLVAAITTTTTATTQPQATVELALNLAPFLGRARNLQDWITTATTAAQHAGDKSGAALSNLGLALREVRRFEEAIEAHQQAVEILRQLGDHHSEAIALSNLGLALSEDGQTGQARIAWAEAAATYEAGGSIERHRRRERVAGRASRPGLAVRM